MAVDDDNDDSTVIFGDLHNKLAGGRSSKETIMLDSGCSRDIGAQSIVSDLGLRMRELERPLHIVSAEGNALDIIGTTTLFKSSQATGDKRRMIEAAVLRGGKDRELLVSLKNLKKFRIIHSTFPQQNIDDFLELIRKIKLLNNILHFIMLNMHITSPAEHISRNHPKKHKIYKINL